MDYTVNNSFIYCPYCGEKIEILVDSSAGSQNYIEDCQVCCAPIEITIEVDYRGKLESVFAHSDAD